MRHNRLLTHVKKGFALALVCGTTAAVSQSMVFTGKLVTTKGSAAARVSPAVLSKMNQAFKNYELYSLDGNAIHEYSKNKDYVDFRLELGTNHVFDISLELNDMRAWNYRLVVLTDAGEVVMPHYATTTYKGWANHSAEQHIRVSIYDGAIKGYIMQNGEELFIEPVNHYIDGATEDLYMVYKMSDVIFEAGISCGVTEMEKSAKNFDLPAITNSLVCKEADFARACDKSFTTERGSSAAAVTEMNNILNMMAGRYADPQIDIKYKLVTDFVVATSGTDPWVTGTGSSALLTSFKDWGNGGGFGAGITYDMANLWTNRNLDNSGVIGLAYVGVVCSAASRYGIMEHYGAVGSAINYVDETHECGHMWNAQHTASNSTYIMSPSIGNGNTQWDATTINSITTHKNSRSCLANCTTTGINENTSALNTIGIFPNPSNGNIEVKFNQNEKENSTLEIRNAIGQLIYSESLGDFSGTFNRNVDLSAYGKGLYLLTLKGVNATVSKKIIIE